MRKIKLYIAVSLDGYIATPDGGVEWLNQFQISKNEDYGYKSGEISKFLTDRLFATYAYLLDIALTIT